MRSALQRALDNRGSMVKVRRHTPVYASVPGQFAWCNFGVIPSPNHAIPRQQCASAQFGVIVLNDCQQRENISLGAGAHLPAYTIGVRASRAPKGSPRSSQFLGLMHVAFGLPSIHLGVFGRYDRGRLMIVSPESSPRKSLHLPRQQKMCGSDGKSDGKGRCQSTPIPLNMRACATC